MNTITVTCPQDSKDFVVVVPGDSGAYESLEATCPSCNEQLSIVYPDEMKESKGEKSDYRPLVGGLDDWETPEVPPAPYTGSDEYIPHDQYINAKISELGTFGSERFQIWYTPEHQAPEGDDIAYIVRGDLETGVKTKNVYSGEKGGRSYLYVKNRGVPRDSDKKWTYLSRAECHARAIQAGIKADDIRPDGGKEGRYRVLLEQEEKPLINKDGELNEELVMELARTLVAFQTHRSTALSE